MTEEKPKLPELPEGKPVCHPIYNHILLFVKIFRRPSC